MASSPTSTGFASPADDSDQIKLAQDTEEDGIMDDYMYSKPLINGWNLATYAAKNEYMPITRPNSIEKGVGRRSRTKVKQKKVAYGPQDFALGDIVWAKSGKRYLAWPTIVIDPMLQALEAVLSSCIPGAICVMYFGYSKNGKQRDYSWVKGGMIFPFLDYLDRMLIRRSETHALAVDVDWFFHSNPLSLMKGSHCVNFVSRFVVMAVMFGCMPNVLISVAKISRIWKTPSITALITSPNLHLSHCI